ncbi:MAG: helix-turn-helix domain-containing protein [Bacteroidota bacterium]
MDGWNIYWLLILLGALQGLVMGVILWRSDKGQQGANRFLAVLLWLAAYHLTVEFLRTAGLVTIHHFAYQVLLDFHWGTGVLLFFYTCSFLDPNFKLSGRTWWHLLPVAIQAAFSFWVKVQNLYWNGNPDDLPFLGADSYVLWMHTPFQYIVLSGLIFWYAMKGKKRITEFWAAAPKATTALTWLHRMLTAFQAFAVLCIVTATVDYLFFNYAFEPFFRYPVGIGFSALIYAIALAGFLNRQTKLPRPATKASHERQSEHAALLSKLDQLMQDERLFLDPEINLAQLAEKLATKPYQLTQALNRTGGQTFRQYLNGYRIKEAIRLLTDPGHAHFTTVAIGFEAGFNSKASFNRIIKNETGKSPGQWRTEAGIT